jgi:hypothetical protein
MPDSSRPRTIRAENRVAPSQRCLDIDLNGGIRVRRPPVPPHKFLGDPVRNFGSIQYEQLRELLLNWGKEPEDACNALNEK